MGFMESIGQTGQLWMVLSLAVMWAQGWANKTFAPTLPNESIPWFNSVIGALVGFFIDDLTVFHGLTMMAVSVNGKEALSWLIGSSGLKKHITAAYFLAVSTCFGVADVARADGLQWQVGFNAMNLAGIFGGDTPSFTTEAFAGVEYVWNDVLEDGDASIGLAIPVLGGDGEGGVRYTQLTLTGGLAPSGSDDLSDLWFRLGIGRRIAVMDAPPPVETDLGSIPTGVPVLRKSWAMLVGVGK